MIYWNEKEEKIIGRFISNMNEAENKTMTLKWKDSNQVIALYDSLIEDENNCDMDDDNYEEFWSFVFKVIKVTGKPPIHITEDNYFCIDYRNFPDEIIANGVKIN